MKINNYIKDTNVNANDKWIGSDFNNFGQTKNFSPTSIAEYYNHNQVIDSPYLKFTYQTLNPGEQRYDGTISFVSEIGPSVAFSSISTFLLSKKSLKDVDVSNYIGFLNGGKVILSRGENIDDFGFYKITNIIDYVTDTDFFVVSLDYIAGHGSMVEDKDYLISLVVDSYTLGESTLTKTSDLINDGEDGTHPFITLEDLPPSASTLTEVLLNGNETGGRNIKINNADAIELENGSLIRKGTYDFGGFGDVIVSGITNDGDGYIAGIMGWGDPSGTKWSDLNGVYIKTSVAVTPSAFGGGDIGMHTPEPGTFNYYLENPISMGSPNSAWNGVAYFLAPGNRSGWGDPNNNTTTDTPVNYWRLCVLSDYPYVYFTNPSSDPYNFPTSGWIPIDDTIPNSEGGNGYDYIADYGGGFTASISNTLNGDGGISRICSIGYEDNWQAGVRYVFSNSGTIRHATNCFTIIPDSSFDYTKRFAVGSLWTLDNGDTYECINNDLNAAIWELKDNNPQTLQDVTDNGDTTTNGITVGSLTVGNLVADGYSFSIGSIGDWLFNYTPYVGLSLDDGFYQNTFITTGGLQLSKLDIKSFVDVNFDSISYRKYDSTGYVTEYEGSLNANGLTLKTSPTSVASGNIKTDLLTSSSKVYQLPNASGTIALTSNIGTWGTLNYPTWTTGTPFVKMTAAGTFSLDTNTYLTTAAAALTYYPIPTGTISQYIRGDGSLAAFPSVSVPNLNSVTSVGNSSLSPILLNSTGSNEYLELGNNSILFRNTGFNYISLQPLSPATSTKTIYIPDANGTIALLSDIPTLVAGTNITIDDTDPLNPIISSSGGVTSVGLTMPSAFSVTNSPITSSGDIAVTGAGLVSQYIRGDGTLANFPASTGGGASVSYYLNGSVSQGTIGGVAYKEMNGVPVIGAGTDFTINADGYIAQFITDAGDPNKLLIPAGNWNFETYFSASSGGGSPRFYIELYKYDGTTFTLIASNSATPEYITGGTAIDLYFTALAVPSTVLLATDRLAVRFYVIHSGRTIKMHTENSHLSQIITTFTTGLTALNGLTQQVQYLAVGTSGTDFAISSITDTHTFNLPTASAANRGALSSTDWSTFNSKQNALSYTPFRFIATNTTPHTGTLSETTIAMATIVGGTFNSSDVMKVFVQTSKPLTLNSVSYRIRINTTNTLAGAVQVGSFTTINTLSYAPITRTFTLAGNNLIGNFNNAVSDLANTAGTIGSTSYNTSNTLYVFFTVQLGNTLDSATINLMSITN